MKIFIIIAGALINGLIAWVMSGFVTGPILAIIIGSIFCIGGFLALTLVMNSNK